MRKLLIFLALVGYAGAQCTVGGSGQCEVGSGHTYATIQACATAMSAGQTCRVFAGTYAEHPTISAGTAGNYKTILANGTDIITVQGFNIASHDKILGNCSPLQGTKLTATCGFFITNPSSPGTACISGGSSNTDMVVDRNNMYACGTVTFGHSGIESNVIFTNNSIAYPDCTQGATNTGPGVEWITNNSLFDSNDLSHDSDGIHNAGSNNVFRNYSHHDSLATECGTNSGNCHIDMIETEPNQASNNLLFENNRNWNIVSAAGSHTYLLQADVCGGNCSYVIGRFTQIAHVDVGFEDDNLWQFGKWYSNTLVDVAPSNLTSGVVDQFSHGSAHGSAYNNIYQNPTDSGTNFIAASGAGGTNDAFWTGGHNLAYCTGSPCSVPGNTYGSGTWAGVATYIFGQNPLLTAYSSSALGNLALLSGSPARNAGTFLTTANGAGVSSTALIVVDEAFFQDGTQGLPGVQGDGIRVGSFANPTVQITAVNHATHTLTLASPITWSNGASIWLCGLSDGTNVCTDTTGPDLGAIPFTPSGGTVATPTFSPVAGTYTGTQSITITTSTGGATLCYTTDGSTPTANGAGTCTHGTTYSSAVSVAASETLKAVGSFSGDTDSAVGSATYIIQALTPTFSPIGGAYAGGQTITITSVTSGVTICVTYDGSTPTATSGSCTNGVTLTNGGTIAVPTSSTLEAIATATNHSNSGTGSAIYSITLNGTAPLYQSTTSTAAVGTIIAPFGGGVPCTVNSTGNDTSLNPSPLDGYTCLTNNITFGGASGTANNSCGGGGFERMWSALNNRVFIAATGGFAYAYELDLSGVYGQLKNTGALPTTDRVLCPVETSWVNDNLVYNVTTSGSAPFISINKNTFPGNNTHSSASIVDLGSGTVCPGIPAGQPTDVGGFSVGKDDAFFSVVLSYTNGQDTDVWGVVYSPIKGCATVNMAPVSANWISTHTYATSAFVTPTTGNTGGYTFEVKTSGTSGGSAPTWNQTPGASIVDGTITWVNIGIAGAYYNFCTSSCTPTTTNTGTLSTANTCTTGTNCSCWGGVVHNSQMSGDGTDLSISFSDGQVMGEGACSGKTATAYRSDWNPGTSFTQWGHANGTDAGGDFYDGHPVFGNSHVVSAGGTVYAFRSLTNIITYTAFQSIPTCAQESHISWPYPPSAPDSYPAVFASSDLPSSGCGTNTSPFAFANEIYAGYPLATNQAFSRFGHTFSCNPINGLWAACSGGQDSWFACGNAIVTVSNDNNWAILPSGMLLGLGLDSSSLPRCDAFLVHIGQGVLRAAPSRGFFSKDYRNNDIQGVFTRKTLTRGTE